MSERPFMQLYVSDFLGDTLELSTEGIGAYMLLLMAMWNAGGTLPDDEAKLARITRMSIKKWRAIATDLMKFFERDNGRITHQRLTKELQKSERKSELRASAGERGGKAKALKTNDTTVANATGLPKHLPDTRYQKEIEPIAQQTIPAALRNRWDELQSACLEAAGLSGFRTERSVKLQDLSPIRGLLEKGYSLENDILSAIRDKAASGHVFTNWAYIVPIVIERAAKRSAIPVKAAAPAEDWPGRMKVWRETQTWGAWGPRPGERGCRVPPELLSEAA